MATFSALNRNILRTLLVVGFSSLLPKVALVIRDLLIANHYGTSDMVDAFLAALSLPSILVQVIVQTFASSLIPAFMHIRSQEGDSAARLLSGKCCFYGGGFLLLLTLLLFLASPLLVSAACPGFSPEKQALTTHYARWLMPLIALQGYVCIGSALLNARNHFALTTLLPAITPMLVLGSLLLPMAAQDIRPAIFATLGGALCEALVVLALLRRHDIPLWLRGKWRRESLEPLPSILGQSLPMVASMMFINANLLIDQGFASTLGSGGVAILVFGNKVPAFVLSLAAFPIGTAVLPHFSRHAAAEDWAGLRRSLWVWSNVCFWLALPLTLLLAWWSRDIVQFLFERGKFSAADVDSVSLVQMCYLAQLPGYMLGYLGARMITSLRQNHILLKIAAVSFSVNTVGDYVLMHLFGLPGIATTTALTYSVTAVAIMLVLSSFLRQKTR